MEKNMAKRMACLMAVVLALGGCYATAEEAPVGLSKTVATEIVQQVRDEKAAEIEADHPQVRTLANGVKVQRTPVTQDNPHYGSLYNPMGFNINYLDAERRGCGACHMDLAELTDSMKSYPHPLLNSGADVDVTVEQCIVCHTAIYDRDRPNMEFGNLMHIVHGANNQAFSALGGDCWSCHYSNISTGEMQLWDSVKHDVLEGISKIPAEQVQSEMSFDWTQDKVLGYDQVYNVNWFYNEGSIYRYFAGLQDVEPDPDTDGVYDQWTIEIGEEVANPFTMTLSEMIETFGMETATMKHHCAAVKVGVPWIGNYEITGIPVSKIFEYAGINDGVNTIDAYGCDGFSAPSRWSMVEDYEAYLVLAVDGKALPYYMGYPVQFWVAGEGAWSCTKEVYKLTVSTAESQNCASAMLGMYDAEGVSCSECNVALVDFVEGQIIEAGQPFTFEGYADSWDDCITAIEFSFDRGETWMTCETPDSQIKDWVYWYLTWENPQPGAYTIMVRAIADNGAMTYKPMDYLVNVQ